MKFRFQRKYLSIPYVIFMALFIIVPIFLIAYYAFSDANGHLSFAAAQKFFSDPSKIDVIFYCLCMIVKGYNQ